MIDKLLHTIYATNLNIIVIIIFISVLLWSMLCFVLKKYARLLSEILLFVSVAFVLYGTVFSRESSIHECYLFPFSSFLRAIKEPEIYRSMIMNVLMFLPVGLSLPYLFRSRKAKRILLTVLAGFCFSLFIELMQFVFSLGEAETDDVICNTLGTTIGSCAYMFSMLWSKVFKKKRTKTLDKMRRKDENA